MKLLAATQQTNAGPLPKPIKRNPEMSKKASSQIPPPDEETLKRLNAIVKQHPFCIYYKEKKNDPL